MYTEYVDTHIMQDHIELLEDLGFRYGLQLSPIEKDYRETFPLFRGFLVALLKDGYKLKIKEKGVYRKLFPNLTTAFAKSFVASIPPQKWKLNNLFCVLTDLTDKASTPVLERDLEILETKKGLEVTINVDVVKENHEYLLTFIPEITRPDIWPLRDFWEGKDKVIEFLSDLITGLEFDKGLRFFIDPLCNEMGFWTIDESVWLVPSSEEYIQQFELWLERKYGKIDNALENLGNPKAKVPNFEVLASVVPVSQDKGAYWVY